MDILSKPIEFEQLKQAIVRAVGWKFTGNEIANTVLEYIHAHYYEKMELETLANYTFCSPSHIARDFKKHTGMTVISYVHKVRIEKSIEKMTEEGLSVKEAAEEVGYQSLNNFYKYFKQYTGMAPAAYLKRKKRFLTDKTRKRR